MMSSLCITYSYWHTHPDYSDLCKLDSSYWNISMGCMHLSKFSTTHLGSKLMGTKLMARIIWSLVCTGRLGIFHYLQYNLRSCIADNLQCIMNSGTNSHILCMETYMSSRFAHFCVCQLDNRLNTAHDRQISLAGIFCNKLQYWHIPSKVVSIVDISFAPKMHMFLVGMYFNRYHYRQTQLSKLDSNTYLNMSNNIHCICCRYLIHLHRIWVDIPSHKFLSTEYDWIYN